MSFNGRVGDTWDQLIDGGVIDDAELAALLTRTAAELRPLFADLDSGRGKQIDAVAVLLETVARRLTTPPPPSADVDLLQGALAAGDDATALASARAVAAAELERMAPPDWELFA